MLVDEMIAAVKRHALLNYEHDGWDFVIECWEDKDIRKIVEPYTTEVDAILAVRQIVTVMDSRRKDIETW